ncbi:MAG: hypothetical protein R6X02_09235 [Enhygromyxa sp.]
MTLVPATLTSRLCERLFGSAELPAELAVIAAEGSTSGWRELALDTSLEPRMRCFAAFHVDDVELWAGLYLDTNLAGQRDFMRLCFPAYRRWPSPPGSLRLPAWSFDSRRFELEAMLRAFATQDADHGRVYWSALKRRYPKWKKDIDLCDIFAPAFRRGRTWIHPDELGAAATTGRFEVLVGTFRNAELIRRTSTLAVTSQQLLLTFHTIPTTEERVAADPWFRTQLARFQLSIVPGFELAVEPVTGEDAFPCLRNMVAWARIDTQSIPGAWLLEEMQSLLVQRAAMEPSGVHADNRELPRLSSAERRRFAATVESLFAGWDSCVLFTVLESARKNQVGALYIRPAARVLASSHQMRISTARRIYGQLPREFGFAPRDYVDPRSGTTHSLLHRRP